MPITRRFNAYPRRRSIPIQTWGDRFVTVERGLLPKALIDGKLANGLRYAQWAIAQGLINDAYLACAGQTRIAGGTLAELTKFSQLEECAHRGRRQEDNR